MPGVYGLAFAAGTSDHIISYGGTFPAPASPATLQTFQRTTRTGGAGGMGAYTIPIVINPSVSLWQLAWRLRDATAPTTVYSNWQDIGPFSTGSQTISLSVPVRLAQYVIDLRANKDTATIITSNAFMVGEVIGLLGQSLAVRCYQSSDTTYYINTTDGSHSLLGSGAAGAGFNLGLTTSPYVTVYANVAQATVSWAQPSDSNSYSGAFISEFGRLYMAAYGCPIALIGAAQGSTAATFWAPGGAGNTNFKAAVNAATGSVGGMGLVIFWQGHSDTSNWPLAWVDTVRNLLVDFQTTWPSGGFKFLVSTMPNIQGTAWGGTYGINNIRQAGARVVSLLNAASSGSAAQVEPLDLAESDGVHPQNYGVRTTARYFFRAYQKLMGTTTDGTLGPTITGATRATGSNVVQLTVTHNAGTDLQVWQTAGPALPTQLTGGSVTTAANQFTVYADPVTYSGQSVVNTAIAVSGLAFPDATHINLTMGSTPADNVTLSVRYRQPPDANSTVIQTGIYDNNIADGISPGRALSHVTGQVEIICPAPLTVVVSNISNISSGAGVTVSGTYTGTAPSALNYAIDGGSFSSASSPTIGSGTFLFAIPTSTISDGYHRIGVQNVDATAVVGWSNYFWTGSVPTFNPLLLNGATAPSTWIDASNVGTIFRDVFATSRAAIGDTIYRVNSADGSGHDWVSKFSPPAFTTYGPIWQANTLAGKPVIHVTGSNPRLETLLEAVWQKSLDGGPLTVIACYAPLATSGAYSMLQSSSGNSFIIYSNYNATINTFRSNASSIQNGALITGTSTKVVIRYLGASTTNGNKAAVKVGTGTMVENSVNTGSSTSGTWGGLTIGNTGNVDLAELIIYAAAATDAQRDAAFTYLTAKWG
jgi:hypothetical protein